MPKFPFPYFMHVAVKDRSLLTFNSKGWVALCSHIVISALVYLMQMNYLPSLTKDVVKRVMSDMYKYTTLRGRIKGNCRAI